MKKIILLFLVILFNCDVFAQKSYVFIKRYYTDGYYAYIEGDVPTNIEGLTTNDRNYKGQFPYYIFGNPATVFNKFAQEGFTIEYLYSNSYNDQIAILSRNINPSPSSIQHIQSDADEDGEIREVARYNLQGMPIGNYEKGIQIIVYSNYTTRTVIVE